jgi:D-3-phosphoglycerate dehydrogenase
LPALAYVQTLTHMTDAAEMAQLLEKEKSRFVGGELKGKTLGIVGLGAIGSMVADMALAMGMKVVGFDPALSIDAAWRLSNAVTRMENLQSLMARSDYVSVHVPAMDATHHMVNAEALARDQERCRAVELCPRNHCRPGRRVAGSLDQGKLSRYVCDFPEPAMLGRSDVIATPHIGASTEESEENCAMMAANQLMDFLENGNITNSVNFPAIAMARSPGTWRITFANDNVPGVLGNVLSVLASNQVNVVDMINKSRGELAFNIMDVEHAPSAAVVAAIQATEHVVRVRVIAPGVL